MFESQEITNLVISFAIGMVRFPMICKTCPHMSLRLVQFCVIKGHKIQEFQFIFVLDTAIKNNGLSVPFVFLVYAPFENYRRSKEGN